MKAYRVFRIDPIQPTAMVESSAYELRERADGERRLREMAAAHFGFDPAVSYEVREEELPATWKALNGNPIRMTLVFLGDDEEATDLDLGGKRCGKWMSRGPCALVRGHDHPCRK